MNILEQSALPNPALLSLQEAFDVLRAQLSVQEWEKDIQPATSVEIAERRA